MKTPKAPYVLAAFGIGLLTLLVYAFLYVPKMNHAKALDTERASVAAEDRTLQQRADIVAAKVKNLPALASQVTEFGKAFPSEPAQKELMTEILDAGSATGVTVTAINPSTPAGLSADPAAAGSTAATTAPPAAVSPANGAPASAGPLAEVALTINASGDPSNLLAFMQKIESLARPFVATEVTMTKGERSSILAITGRSYVVSPLVKPAAPEEEK